jgi:hypothetical protein
MTICLINNKKYIGKYEGKESDKYLGSGKLLKRSILKHGKENFKRIILEKYNNKNDCREGEKKWIKLFNAVEAKDFYNIAHGGEGGDTLSGILGEDRIKLITKLKTRRWPSPPKGVTSVYNVKTKEILKVTIEEFKNNNLLLGIQCKGLYITPNGIFCSSLIASKYNEGLDLSSLIKRCKNSGQIIKKCHTSTDKRLTEKDLGKTFSDCNYGFIPVENIDILFLKKNNIIKN